MPASTGRLGGIERKARFLAAHEEHLLADAGADGVDRDERPAGRLASGVSGWTTSSLRPTRFSSLRVATTSPMTRASCMAQLG